MNPFVGRKQELQDLRNLSRLKMACIVTIQGRRRIGKSRLVQEFAQDRRFLSFTGIAPTDLTTAQDERDEFAKQLAKIIGSKSAIFTDWSDAFNYLTECLTDEPTVIVF